MRPIFRRTRKRSDGHLFITVIADLLVQTIRKLDRQPPDKQRTSEQPAQLGHQAGPVVGTGYRPSISRRSRNSREVTVVSRFLRRFSSSRKRWRSAEKVRSGSVRTPRQNWASASSW